MLTTCITMGTDSASPAPLLTGTLLTAPSQWSMPYYQIHHGAGERWLLPLPGYQPNTKEDGILNISVFRKQTHRYLQFNSHQSASVKRAAVRSLFDRARNITLQKEDMQKEDHLTATFKQNGYPLAFIHSISSMQKPLEDPDDEEQQEKPPVVAIPYVSCVSERIRKACEKFDLKVVFKSGPTLCSLFTRVKDPLTMEKLAGVVYQIPCQCGKVYVGEMQRRLETWVKEHKDACIKGHTEKSAIAEHMQDQQHTIDGRKPRCWTRPQGLFSCW